jgi:Protein of unknown function (DUF3830)
MVETLDLVIGGEPFVARLRWDLAPQSCQRLLALLPYSGEVVHARWSGEAMWSPLGPAWPRGEILAPENATQYPKPGEILLYADELSEPELLIPYGSCRFASKEGTLEGNPVLVVEKDLARLAQPGADTLRRGAQKVSMSVSPGLGSRAAEARSST